MINVDVLDRENIQTHSLGDSITHTLVTAPGISLVRDEDQPRCITARGIQACYNT